MDYMNISTSVRDEGNNKTTSKSADVDFCVTYEFVMCSIIVPLLVFFGFIGNCISFFVFNRDKVKTSTVYLFQSLAVIDNFLLITVLPVYAVPPLVERLWKTEDKIIENKSSYDNKSHENISYEIKSGEGEELLALNIIEAFVFPFATLAQTITIWLTVLVAFNRYLAVCKPYKAAKLCTVSQAKCQLTVVVLFSIIFNLPKFLHPKIVTKVDSNNVTFYDIEVRSFADDPIYMSVYEAALYFIFMILLPLTILNILSVKLVKALKELNRKRVDMLQNSRQKNDNNITLVLIIVVVVFIVCQTPTILNRLMWIFQTNSTPICGSLHFYVRLNSNVFAVTNSSVNFIIYFAFNPRFRQTFLELCCCSKPREDNCRDGGGKTSIVPGAKEGVCGGRSCIFVERDDALKTELDYVDKKGNGGLKVNQDGEGGGGGGGAKVNNLIGEVECADRTADEAKNNEINNMKNTADNSDAAFNGNKSSLKKSFANLCCQNVANNKRQHLSSCQEQCDDECGCHYSGSDEKNRKTFWMTAKKRSTGYKSLPLKRLIATTTKTTTTTAENAELLFATSEVNVDSRGKSSKKCCKEANNRNKEATSSIQNKKLEREESAHIYMGPAFEKSKTENE